MRRLGSAASPPLTMTVGTVPAVIKPTVVGVSKSTGSARSKGKSESLSWTGDRCRPIHEAPMRFLRCLNRHPLVTAIYLMVVWEARILVGSLLHTHVVPVLCH